MSCINFVKLCEEAFNELDLPLISEELLKEAEQEAIRLGQKAEKLKRDYSALKNTEPDRKRKDALESKRRIELHKVRQELIDYIIRRNLVSREIRDSNPLWFDDFVKTYFSAFPGIGFLNTAYITATPPKDPPLELLPPIETLPLAMTLTLRELNRLKDAQREAKSKSE